MKNKNRCTPIIKKAIQNEDSAEFTSARFVRQVATQGKAIEEAFDLEFSDDAIPDVSWRDAAGRRYTFDHATGVWRSSDGVAIKIGILDTTTTPPIFKNARYQLIASEAVRENLLNEASA